MMEQQSPRWKSSVTKDVMNEAKLRESLELFYNLREGDSLSVISSRMKL